MPTNAAVSASKSSYSSCYPKNRIIKSTSNSRRSPQCCSPMWQTLVYSASISSRMNDTSDAIAKVVLERYRSMTPTDRCLVVSSLFEAARAIIESSLPSSLTVEQRRLSIAQRLYGGELPEAALLAHANYAPTTR